MVHSYNKRLSSYQKAPGGSRFTDKKWPPSILREKQARFSTACIIRQLAYTQPHTYQHTHTHKHEGVYGITHINGKCKSKLGNGVCSPVNWWKLPTLRASAQGGSSSPLTSRVRLLPELLSWPPSWSQSSQVTLPSSTLYTPPNRNLTISLPSEDSLLNRRRNANSRAQSPRPLRRTLCIPPSLGHTAPSTQPGNTLCL